MPVRLAADLLVENDILSVNAAGDACLAVKTRANWLSCGTLSPTIPLLGWGVVFADFDNDGWLDILMVNGHVYPQADKSAWGTTWEQRPLSFYSEQGHLKLAAPVQGGAHALSQCGGELHHWIKLQLVGGSKGPLDPVGTTAYLTANGFKQRQDLVAGGSFASSSDHRLDFRLGTATKIDKLEIHWPSGLVEQVAAPPLDQISRVVEGKDKILRPGR